MTKFVESKRSLIHLVFEDNPRDWEQIEDSVSRRKEYKKWYNRQVVRAHPGYSFSDNLRRPRGPSSDPWTKEKAKESSRKSYKRNRDEIQRKRTKYYRDHPLRQKLRVIKHSCSKTGLPFEEEAVLSLDIPEYCPVLGIKLEPAVGAKGPKSSSPSIDKIFPELGYVSGNVRIISNRANMLKNNMTLEECLMILRDLEERDGKI